MGFKHLYELVHPDGTFRLIHVTHDQTETAWHFWDQPEACEQP